MYQFLGESYSKCKSMSQNVAADIKPNDSKNSNIALDYGEIVETQEEMGRLRVEWKVPDFMSLRKEPNRTVFSPTFKFLQAEYHIRILTFSHNFCEIRLFSGGSEKPDICTVGTRQLDGTVDKSCGSSGIASLNKSVVLEKQKLEGTLMSPDVLIVTVEMQETEASEETPKEEEPEVKEASDIKKIKGTSGMKEPEVEIVWDSRKVKGYKTVSQGTQTEDLLFIDKKITEHEPLEVKSISKLTKHLEDLFLKGQDHDVTIKVKNRPFKAHKAVLQARSPVFLSMFQHGMEESSSGVVSIDDCDPDVFGQFLRHVYTGNLEMDSAKSAIALFYAADKYDFQELKEACVRYLHNSFSTNTVCDVIKMATVHDEKQLLQRASMFFERNLEEILTTVEWQIFLYNDSTMANELMLKAVLSRSETPEQKQIEVCVECPSCSVKRK